MLVKKLIETGPETIWLATDMPKYFEQFNFVPSKQVPRELARKMVPLPEGNGKTTPKNRIRAMVFSKKK